MLTPNERSRYIASIQALPKNVRNAVAGLNDKQLDTPYREGGWTIRQLVHHLADSHINAYTRLKLLLTEDHPAVKPYNQDAWAVLADSRLPVESSLYILDGVHERWSYLLSHCTSADYDRTLHHPDNGTMNFDNLLQSYADHGEKHLKHITDARTQLGW